MIFTDYSTNRHDHDRNSYIPDPIGEKWYDISRMKGRSEGKAAVTS